MGWEWDGAREDRRSEEAEQEGRAFAIEKGRTHLFTESGIIQDSGNSHNTAMHSSTMREK